MDPASESNVVEAGVSPSGHPNNVLVRVAVVVVGMTLASSALALLLLPAANTPDIFEFLFRRDEPSGAWLSAAAILVATAGAYLLPRIDDGLVSSLSRRPAVFILLFTVACALAANFVYRNHPLSMDEYSALFQARAFAHGKLAGHVPAELVRRLVPGPGWFLQASTTGDIVSNYWPGFALLLTPFVWLGCPWLLNPLIGGASLLLLWYLARTLFAGASAPGWAVLLAAASPAFVVNAISYYSMSAHLLASLGYVALLLEPTPRRLVLAGALGSFALVLHNPVPHAVFALPWIVAIALRQQSVRNLGLLAIGYLPGTLFLGIGWGWVKSNITNPGGGTQGLVAASEGAVKLFSNAISLEFLWARAAGWAELALWAVPGLLGVALVGFWMRKRDPRVQLLAWSALLTLVAYLFVPFSQGHGWGFRYFHSAWGVLPLFGAAALSEPSLYRGFLARMLLIATLASLIVCNGLRFLQVRSFIDDQLAQIPDPPGRGSFQIVFVRMQRGYYTVDLVQDDPFLRGNRWMLLSHGDREDEGFIRGHFPAARIAAENEVATVWQVD
jgi:hypothetical protein